MSINRAIQKGVGLIEVLVTLLVLAVGLLGLAGLQNAALKFNRTAYLESQTQFLIKDVIESMRTSSSPQRFAIDFDEAAPTGTTDCKTTNCSTPNQLADWYKKEWMGAVSAALPNSAVRIRQTDAITKEYEITIRYDDLRGETPNSSAPISKREVSVVTRI